MNAAGEPVLLRPLSLGEIFDRAITLYVRNFLVFTAIMLVVTVPLAIMQYFIGLHSSGDFAQLIQQIQHPRSTAGPTPSDLQTGWTMVMLIVGLVLDAFAVVAIAAGIGRLYRREPVDWQTCYAHALRHTGTIVVSLLAEIGTFAGLVFAGAFAMVIVLTVSLLLARVTPALGVAGIVITVAIMLAWFLGILLCYLVYTFAFNAIGVEGAGSGRAIGSAFSRIFNRSELLRAVLICLALSVVYLGFSILSVSIAALLESMRLHLIEVIVSSLLSIVVTGALAVLMAVYYFDVRIRREGLDMQVQIDDLQPAATVR